MDAVAKLSGAGCAVTGAGCAVAGPASTSTAAETAAAETAASRFGQFTGHHRRGRPMRVAAHYGTRDDSGEPDLLLWDQRHAVPRPPSPRAARRGRRRCARRTRA